MQEESHIVTFSESDSDEVSRVRELLPPNLRPVRLIEREQAEARRVKRAAAAAADPSAKPVTQVYPCPDCGEKFAGQEFLIKHAQIDHNRLLAAAVKSEPWLVLHPGVGLTPPADYVQFDCPDCDLITLNRDEMKKHREKEHKAAKANNSKGCDENKNGEVK